MGKDFRATVTGAERRHEWLEVFGSDTVCVRTPLPVEVVFPDVGVRLCYMLDLDELTEEQREKLAHHLARRIGLAVKEVRKDLQTQGLPILAADVTVTVLNPQKWFL